MAKDKTPQPAPAPEAPMPPPTRGGAFRRLPDGSLQEIPASPPAPPAPPAADTI